MKVVIMDMPNNSQDVKWGGETNYLYIYFVPDTPPPHVSAASMASGNRFNIFSSVSILLLLLLPAHLNSSPSAHCDLPRAARNTQSLHPAVVEASLCLQVPLASTLGYARSAARPGLPRVGRWRMGPHPVLCLWRLLLVSISYSHYHAFHARFGAS